MDELHAGTVLAHYVGNNYHILPGLPCRDLSADDIVRSGWTLEALLAVQPPVYVAADRGPAAPSPEPLAAAFNPQPPASSDAAKE